MNGSPSTTSPAWPTSWPADSFRNVVTWILVAGFAAVVGGVAWITFALAPQLASVKTSSVDPMVLDAGLVIQALIEAVAVGIVLWAMPSMSKFSLRELGFRRPDRRTILIALVGAVAMIVIANGLASLIDSALHSKHEQDVVQLVKSLRDPGSLGFLCFYAIVLAPFFEESIFRVFFFNFGLRWGGFATGATLSGVLFGLAHGDLYAAFPLAVGGAILCAVYYYTRNAWASMISHGIFNAVSILGLIFAPGIFAN